MMDAGMTSAVTPPLLDRTPGPRILLVEDDPVSQAFLVAALESLPARVDAASCCAQARQRCLDAPGHGLWLIDANLPDGSGVELLATLRQSAPGTMALAHTASQQRESLDALIAGGFSDVLVKPLATATLQAAVRRALGDASPAVADAPARYDLLRSDLLPDWDDTAALRALNGHAAHIATLRQLFVDELPSQRLTIATALVEGRSDRARQELHRLRASCGFVGATRLGSTVRMLEREPGCAHALRCFEAAVSGLLVHVAYTAVETDRP